MSQPNAEALRGKTLYFDCFAGIAGDMTLGALLDLGVPEDAVREALGRLPLSGYELEVRMVRRGALLGRHISVLEGEHGHEHAHEHSHAHDFVAPHEHPDVGRHPHVHYRHIREMIAGAGLDREVLERALSMFDRLAAVEAALHGVAVTEVAFHEVGAVDSIVDIVGTAAAMAFLRPRRVVARTVPLGSGMVKTAHGLLPVPAPATLALLQGIPIEAGGPPYELTTPTGALILSEYVSAYGPLPEMCVFAVGHGAGTRDLKDRPNLLRVVAGCEETAGHAATSGSGCLVVTANIDDMNPQLYEPLVEKLFAAGARDAWLTPVQMKKGRPGVLVSALCDLPAREAIVTVLLRESTTLGVRMHTVERRVLERESIEVETEFGRVAIKLGRDPKSGAVWNVAPEFSTCLAQANVHSVPVKAVLSAAIAAFYRK